MLYFISLLQVAQHVSGNHVPIFRSWRLCSAVATCWYCAVTMSGIIQICLSVWVDMFYDFLVYGKSSVRGLCGVLWVVVSLLYVDGDSTTQSSAPEDGHMVARNMLSIKVTSSWFLIHCTVSHTSDARNWFGKKLHLICTLSTRYIWSPHWKTSIFVCSRPSWDVQLG